MNAKSTVMLAILLAPSFLFAQDPKDAEKDPSFWMKQKLVYSQRILGGLAQGDFDGINQSAKAMRGLNKIEAFVRGRTVGYKAQLQVFQTSVDDLVQKSEDGNLDGSTVAFTQMTFSCVNCHKQLREQAK